MTRAESKAGKKSALRLLGAAVTALVLGATAMNVAAEQAPARRRPAPTADAGGRPAHATGDAGARRASEGRADASAPPRASAAADAGASVPSSPRGSSAGDAGALATSDAATPHYFKITPRKLWPAPPPPTPAQIAGIGVLKTQVDSYERGAREYREVITSLIQLHYEEKKKQVLAGLDTNIGIEREELRKARDVAVKRLEEFIGKYSGSRSHPEATPDAMFRLAALYEDGARAEDAKEDLTIGLRPALFLYKRIIREYPFYPEIAGVFYFLGHAYNDCGRIEEAQQVWRAAVCRNHYPYPTPPNPKKPEEDTVLPLVQDKSEEEWIAWRRRYQTPESIAKGGPDAKFVDPYPQDCLAIAQPNQPKAEEPKYVAEIWWQIGNWEFDQLDQGGGRIRTDPDLASLPAVFDYNRAASAYRHSLIFKRAPLYGVALYKYAWTLFKQQRFDAATREFVRLLRYTDEQQKLTGDPGADFRSEAYTYIAGSLTNPDFTGPGPDEPAVFRPDIVDTELNITVQEQKLRVAIDRVQDATLIPQDQPWTPDIYRSLAAEYRGLNHFNSAVEVYALLQKKWPLDANAPDVQASIADTLDNLATTMKRGSPERSAIDRRALEARTGLANYTGGSPWVQANKDNPAALQNAERLVRRGLREAAVLHTNYGRAALVEAMQAGDPKIITDRLERSIDEYRLAAQGWNGFLKQDENAPDAYESRYWLADSWHNIVVETKALHRMRRDRFAPPSDKDLELAHTSAVDVRDSNEDDKYIDNAALWVVDLADVDRDLQYQRWDDSGGRDGIELRTAMKFTGEGDDRKVIRETIPKTVLSSIQARDEYVQIVPPNLDPEKNGVKFQYYSAETYFLYGQFDEARARFEPLWKEHCGQDEFGYKAWEKLITMSNLTLDAERSRDLAEAEKNKTCTVSAAQQASATLIVNPTLQEAAYVRARQKFKQAQNAPAGPEKGKLWREAGGLYESALAAAPARDEAPEAAMNAAYAYKQVGEYGKAIELYQKFIDEYGSDARLTALQKGDAKTKAAPDPKKYAERLKYLNDAYDALGSTYFGFFSYQRAAETFEKIGKIERFDETKRRTAAKNAMVLYAKMGQKEKLFVQYRLFLKLGPSAEERASAEYLVAEYDYLQWDPRGADAGSNRAARIAAEDSLRGYATANKNTPSKYSLEAVHRIAKMKKFAGDPAYRTWFKVVMGVWEQLRLRGGASRDGKNDALLAPYVDYGAEAEFTLLDEEIHEKFDYDTGHHRYAGAIEDIIGKYELDKQGGSKLISKGKYQIDAEEADKYDQRLQRIVETYPSLEWVPAALARRGTLYDSLRTGLYNTVPPQLKYFTPKQDALLKVLENSGRENLENQAAELRDRAKEGWRTRKERELAASDELMVRYYATAVALATRYSVKNPVVSQAFQRLAYFSDIVGDTKLRSYVERTKDPTDPTKSRTLSYQDGMYLRARSGQTAQPLPQGLGAPLPAMP